MSGRTYRQRRQERRQQRIAAAWRLREMLRAHWTECGVWRQISRAEIIRQVQVVRDLSDGTRSSRRRAQRIAA